MSNTIHFGVACGGTGGHIFPGLATAQELAERGHKVSLWLAGKDVELDAIQDWKGDVVTIPAEGFQFGVSLRSVKTVFKLRQAYRTSVALMREKAPDVMLAMGSYASYGPVRAAARLGIPYVLHEANLVPGRAVSLLARQAHTVAVSFSKTGYYLRHNQVVTTGLPLRKELQLAGGKPRPEHDNDTLRILVVGGSRGAQALNETVPHAIAMAVEAGAKLSVEHIVGMQDPAPVEALYQQKGVRARVHKFVQHMEDLYLTADLAVCRSGAATCAELALFGVPALLVPYPYAVRNHQMSNARVLQDAAAADVVAQEDLSATWLRDYLINVIEKPARLRKMAEAMKKSAQNNAAGQLADLLERVAGA
ncbi:MAG TPA: undecaprenyldiphospho-muramoylpentapeptide beta-N-acetylglucosaminyltransferase [Pontiella sp.]